MMVSMGLLTRMILILKDTYTTVPKKNRALVTIRRNGVLGQTWRRKCCWRDSCELQVQAKLLVV